MSIELITLLMVGSIAVLLIMGLPLAFVTGFVALAFAYGNFGLPGIFLCGLGERFSFVPFLIELGEIAVIKALDTKKVENELLFLPTNVTSGIEPSDDPIINTRTEAYAESFGRRTK